MKNISAILLLFVVLCAPAVRAQSTAVDSSLQTIEAAYTNGQYLTAELEARRLMESSGISDSAVVQAEKWIAFALIAQGKTVPARERFLSLLQKDESFDLDRLLTSPKILTVFSDARARFTAQRRNALSDSLQHIGNSGIAPAQTVTVRTIIFPGWEQLHQGRTIPGSVFLGAGAVTLSSGIIFEFLRSDARQKYLAASAPAEIQSTYSTYNNYRKAEIYSFAAFAAVYLLSEIDVFTAHDLTVSVRSSQEGNHFLSFSAGF
ncbi:MAG: hypothetical protein HUU02_16305 [Bacteroidetes bacterium]|nr:hypothetical protein [Bacteroidota bacterium]